MVDVLKYNYPDALIDFLVNKRVFELVRNYPNINKVHAIEKDSIRDIFHVCKEGGYDAAIIVRPLFSIAAAAFASGIKIRLGTGYRWYSFLFNVKHYQHRKHSVKHELEYNLDLLDELGCIKKENLKPYLPVKEPTIKHVEEYLRKKGVDTSKEIIIIHPGSLGSAMKWKAGNFIELIRMIREGKNFDGNILVTGTKSDEQILNIITKEVSDKVYIIKDLNLTEFAALCKIAKMFVSNSTGPIHIAAAAGAFCVGIYSPLTTESEVRWAPYTDKKKIFTPEIGNEKINENLMDKISPKIVFEFIINYMTSKNRKSYEIN